MLDSENIIKYIQKCRREHANGVLDSTIKNSTSIEFWEANIRSSEANKRELIAMAKRGEPRPHSKRHRLGKVFASYIQKWSFSYDKKFDIKIRKLAPHWFIKTAKINKKKLIEMAKRGEPRPIREKHPLGIALNNYLNKKKGYIDLDFVKTIRRLAPHWFKH